MHFGGKYPAVKFEHGKECHTLFLTPRAFVYLSIIPPSPSKDVLCGCVLLALMPCPIPALYARMKMLETGHSGEMTTSTFAGKARIGDKLHWSSARACLTVLTTSFWTAVRLPPQSTSKTSFPCSCISGSSKSSICDRTIVLFMKWPFLP